MKISIPDALFAYEKEILHSLLEQRGHTPVWGAIDEQTEAILTGGLPLDGDVLHSLERLRVVVRFARGRFDLTTEQRVCQATGVAYFPVSGSAATATAEHTLMLMLALLRRLPQANALVQQGGWGRQEIATQGVRDLAGMTVGLVGLGRVGREVVRLLRPFGPHLFYHKRRRLTAAAEESLAVRWVDLETLLRKADIISLHTRSPTATPLLTARHVAMLKPGAIFINTANGRHVDQEALMARLRQGSLVAGLDVFAQEPWTPPLEVTVLPAANLFTPHVAGRSRRTAEILFAAVCAALDQFTAQQQAPPASQESVTGHYPGPLLARVLAKLGPKRPLAECKVQLSAALLAPLPALAPAIKALGCQQVGTLPQARPVLVVETPAGKFTLLVELPPPTLQGATFSTALVPTLSYLLERWQLDYYLWDCLLPRAAQGSLPGRTLLVVGYGRRGKNVAWRARQLGMQVLVAEEMPQRRLDAGYDGFEVFTGEIPPQWLVVNTGVAANGRGVDLSFCPDTIPEGLQDEVTALAVVALYVLWGFDGHKNGQGQEGQTAVAHICDQLLLDLLVATRSDSDVPGSPLWSADRW